MSEEAIVDFGPKGVGRVLCLVDRNDNPLGDDEPEANQGGYRDQKRIHCLARQSL
jgi:hypothetical protein